jgi:hypothetical protein
MRWLLLPLPLMACASYYAVDVVRERAAKDFRCSTSDVKVKDLGQNAFRVHVCNGADVLYVCNKDSASDKDKAGSLLCVHNDDIKPPPGK